MLTKLRFLTQTFILIGIILVTYLNHYENQKVKYGGQAVIDASVILSSIDRVVGKLETRGVITQFIQGDVWAAQIGKVKIVDPLAFIGNVARTKQVYGILFFAALITTAATLLLGKVFCSWICPMGLLFELNDKLRQFLMKRGIPLLKWTLPHWMKYVVLGIGLLSGLLWDVHYFFIIYPPKLVSGEIYFWVTRNSFSFGLLFIFIYLTIELLLAPRIWCRSLCPGGAIYTFLSRFRILRIKNDLKNCTNCGICDRLCPYGLTPSTGKLSGECDHCSICIVKCPVKTLSFEVNRNRR